MIRIKEILKEKNITMNQLSEILGVSRQALSKQVQGKMLVETAEKIASALKVPMWQLFASESEVQKESGGNTIRCPKCNHEFKVKLEVEKEPTGA